MRHLVRSEPLEITVIEHRGTPITIPTDAEILRIKAVLILRRNATRDYADFAALARRMSVESLVSAMEPFDRLYPQDRDQSPLQQLLAQLSNPRPGDLAAAGTGIYRNLAPELRVWNRVSDTCARIAGYLFDELSTAPEALMCADAIVAGRELISISDTAYLSDLPRERIRHMHRDVEPGQSTLDDSNLYVLADVTAACGDALVDQGCLAELRTGARLWYDAAGTPFARLTGPDPTPASGFSEPTVG